MIVDPDHHDYRNFACTACGYEFSAPISCRNRFCPVCSGPRRRRIRSKLRALVAQVKPPFGFAFRHLTLTIANCEDLSAAHRHLVLSYRRLRQRAFWRNKVRGGAIVFELTGRPGSWHLHLHSIIESKYIPFDNLLRHWQKVSGGRGVFITTRPAHVALNYLTTYVTKCELTAIHQREASIALRGARNFTTFGTWHSLQILIPKILFTCPHCGESSWFPLSLAGFVLDKGYWPHPPHG